MTRTVEQPVRPISEITWRGRARIVGRVRSIRVQPWAGVATLEVVLRDDTGGVSVVFLGRRHVAGIRLGATMEVEGMVGLHHEHLAILNPSFEVVAAA